MDVQSSCSIFGDFWRRMLLNTIGPSVTLSLSLDDSCTLILIFNTNILSSPSMTKVDVDTWSVCAKGHVSKESHNPRERVFWTTQIFTQYKKYFAELRAITKYKLCYVEIFPNKEGNFTYVTLYKTILGKVLCLQIRVGLSSLLLLCVSLTTFGKTFFFVIDFDPQESYNLVF